MKKKTVTETLEMKQRNRNSKRIKTASKERHTDLKKRKEKTDLWSYSYMISRAAISCWTFSGTRFRRRSRTRRRFGEMVERDVFGREEVGVFGEMVVAARFGD